MIKKIILFETKKEAKKLKMKRKFNDFHDRAEGKE